MNTLRMLLMALALTSLAACYESDDPLISAETADYPIRSLVYLSEDGERVSVLRQGSEYVARLGDETVRFLAKDYGKDLYLLQFLPGEGGDEAILYGVVRLDRKGMTIEAFRSVAKPEDFKLAHIRECPEQDRSGHGCLADGQELVDLINAQIADGIGPEQRFKIVSIE